RIRPAACEPDVVDALEHDQVRDARLTEHIMIEARERVDSVPVAEQTIAADSYVENAHLHVRLGKPFCEMIGPPVVCVDSRMGSVGNRIAECDNRSRL